MPSSSRRSVGMLLALSLLWGSSWIANQVLREQGGPLHLAMLRYLLAGLSLTFVLGVQLLLNGLQRSGQRRISHSHASATATFWAKHRGFIAVNLALGCTMFAIPDLLLVWAAAHGAAAWTPMVYAGLPLGLLLAAGELRALAVLGVGAMLVVLNGSLPLTEDKLIWVLPIVGAVLLQGWSLIHAQRHLTAVISLPGVMVQVMAATLLLSAFLRMEAPNTLPILHWPTVSLAALCMLAGLATAAAYPLYYRLLQNLDPAQLAISEWLQTLVAIGESAILLHQRPDWPMLSAAIVLVGCSVLLLRGKSPEIKSSLNLIS